MIHVCTVFKMFQQSVKQALSHVIKAWINYIALRNVECISYEETQVQTTLGWHYDMVKYHTILNAVMKVEQELDFETVITLYYTVEPPYHTVYYTKMLQGAWQ